MDRIVPVAPAKITQIREAGRKQLSPEEFEELESLLGQLQVYGLTPYINTELGKLMGKLEWGLEISESPQWAEALIACDVAFLGTELKEMCDEMGVSSYGHKKELCRHLYLRKHPAVVEVMEPFLKGEKIPPPQPPVPPPLEAPKAPPVPAPKPPERVPTEVSWWMPDGAEYVVKALPRNEWGVHKRLPIGLTLVRKYISQEAAEQSLIKEGASRIKPVLKAKPPQVKPLEVTREIVYKPPYTPKLKLSREEAENRLEFLKGEADLTQRRLSRLKETQKKNPQWKGYDPMIDEEVTIDTRIEEQQAVSEMLTEEITTLEKAMGGER